MQEVTIIIPNYNGKSLLENCFRTLENQSYKDFKVLVVDNGSTDGSTDIKSDVLDVEWIALNENLGFCGAVNLAVQKTGTPYVILLNNDTETDKYFVEWLLRGIKKSDHIFSCGAQMIDYKNHEYWIMQGIYILLWDGPLPEEKADHVKIMKRQSGCFRAVPEQQYIAWI